VERGKEQRMHSVPRIKGIVVLRISVINNVK
jgi:hypothetical protein